MSSASASTTPPAAMEVEVSNTSRKRQHVEQAQQEAARQQEERVKNLDAGQVNLLAAITGELDIKLTPVTENITMLQENMKEVKAAQTKQDIAIKENTTKLDSLEKRLSAVEEGRVGSTSASDGQSTISGTFSTTSSTHTPTLKRTPVAKRTVVCVGGFRLCEAEEITKYLEELKPIHAGIEKVHAVGSYANRGKIIFDTSDHMWGFMTRMKGKKLSSELAAPDRPTDPETEDGSRRLLWHSIDKYPEELAMGNKCNHAKDLLAKAIEEKFNITPQEAVNAIDAGKDGGSVVLLTKSLPQVVSNIPIKLYIRTGQAHILSVARGAQAAINTIGLNFNLEDNLGEINDPPRR